MEVSHSHGDTPLSLDGLFQGKSQSKMMRTGGTHSSGNHQVDIMIYDSSYNNVINHPWLGIASLCTYTNGDDCVMVRLWHGFTHSARNIAGASSDPMVLGNPMSGGTGSTAGFRLQNEFWDFWKRWRQALTSPNSHAEWGIPRKWPFEKEKMIVSRWI